MKNKKNLIVLLTLIIALIIILFISLFVGSSNMFFFDQLKGLFMKGTAAQNRIMWKIRIPRIIAGVVAGAGLSLAGLLMQTTLNNPMASPSTMGVANAAVFGANLSILIFSVATTTVTSNVLKDTIISSNPYQTSLFAFIFSILSILIVLGLCKIKNFNQSTIVLIGIALAAIWTALTTLIQYYATDIGLSQAIIWNIGDLSRATYKTDLLLFIVVLVGSIISMLFSYKYNALLLGADQAKTSGVNVTFIRMITLIISSLITACAVSFLGVISFVGIICPHIMKRIVGNNHKILIPTSLLSGSVLLVVADTLSRTIANGSALPVGVITTLFGAPFFLFLIFSKRGKVKNA